MVITGGTSGITDGVSGILDVAGDCITFLVSNPLGILLIGASLVGVGFGIFKKMKRSAR